MKDKLRQFVALLLALAVFIGTAAATQTADPVDVSTEHDPVSDGSTVPADATRIEGISLEQEVLESDGPEQSAVLEGQPDDTGDESNLPADEYADLKIRVGLAYSGSSRGTLVEAKLLIADGYGTGFRFGYYDPELNFVPLATADVRGVSVVKTKNVYLSGSDYHEGVGDADKTIGCYHLQYPEVFDSYESAMEVCAQYQGAFIAWINGEYRVRANSYTSNDSAQAAASAYSDGSWTVSYTSIYAVNIILSDTTQILFQFDGDADKSLGIVSGLEDGQVYPCWFKGYKYQGGMRYQRINGENITVVNIVPLDDYLKGVVPYESVKVWPLETLKAQALCAKNYALVSRNKHRDNGFDVCYTTDCQVYYGLGSGNASFQPSELSNQAVDEIRGLYVWYGENKLAQTYFYSSNGGGSEDVSNVWGSKQENYPYLAGVIDPYEATVEDQIPNYYFSSTWTNDQLTQILRTKGYATNTMVSDFEVEMSKSGNVIGMKFTYANGRSNTFKAQNTSWIRNKLGCRSLHFTVLGGGDTIPQECRVNGDQTLDSLGGMYAIGADGIAYVLDTAVPYAITGSGEIISTGAQSTVPEGTYLINGTGWGHNIGYSQWGGYAMAKLGYNCKEIIEFYYTGATVGPKAE